MTSRPDPRTGVPEIVEAIREAIDTEWHNGNITGDAAERLTTQLAARVAEALAAQSECNRDAALDNLIARTENPQPKCRDCEVGEPHMCPVAPREADDGLAERVKALADEWGAEADRWQREAEDYDEDSETRYDFLNNVSELNFYANKVRGLLTQPSATVRGEQ